MSTIPQNDELIKNLLGVIPQYAQIFISWPDLQLLPGNGLNGLL